MYNSIETDACIAVNAPTIICKLDVKKVFNTKLTSVVENGISAILCVISEWYLVVIKLSVNPHGSGVYTSIENSLLL